MRKRGQQREKEDEEAVASVMKSMLNKVETDVDYETGPFQLPYESNFANKVLIVFILNQELLSYFGPNFPLKIP